MTGPISGSDFAAPIHDRWLEDYRAGERHRYGWVPVSEESIVAFGRLYDPQPFHVDPVAAADGPFGGLIASGLQTFSLVMRVLVDHVISPAAGLGSPGVDELRWLLPVRPGDELAVSVEIVESRVSRSKPDRGVIVSRLEVANRAEEVVMTLRPVMLARTRPA